LPDERSVAAAREALALAASLRGDEELLVLLSGGASALWCAPAPGLSLGDKRRVTELLLREDADIRELNTVRRHLSELKGGGLARAARGRPIHLFAVSDVRGDALCDLGSGPVSADPTSHSDALDVLRSRGLLDRVPAAVRRHLERGGPNSDSPFPPVTARIVASLDTALDAAARGGESLGLRAVVLRDALYGQVESVARSLAAEVTRARDGGAELLVAGGEPTVTVRGPGSGGRAQELALRLALALEGGPAFSALCAGTDGTDGATSAAGAFCDEKSLARATAQRLDVRDSLARSDSHSLLAALGDLHVTGPTDTNVADLALVLVQPAR
jgi:glycerate-2-kinase